MTTGKGLTSSQLSSEKDITGRTSGRNQFNLMVTLTCSVVVSRRIFFFIGVWML